MRPRLPANLTSAIRHLRYFIWERAKLLPGLSSLFASPGGLHNINLMGMLRCCQCSRVTVTVNLHPGNVQSSGNLSHRLTASCQFSCLHPFQFRQYCAVGIIETVGKWATQAIVIKLTAPTLINITIFQLDNTSRHLRQRYRAMGV